jgi:hypothetical protein
MQLLLPTFWAGSCNTTSVHENLTDAHAAKKLTTFHEMATKVTGFDFI